MTRVPHRILVLLSVLVAGYAVMLFGAWFLARDLAADTLLAIGGMAVFTIVGALIEDRRPGNEVGRICPAVGLVLVGSTILRVMAQRLDTEPVAALFQPLRNLVQAPIDRRFNRAHIDAQRTLGAFGERFRNEMDLSHIGGAVVATADESLRPAHAGLWLRRAGR